MSENMSEKIKCKWCNDKTDFSDAPYGRCFECGNHGPLALEYEAESMEFFQKQFQEYRNSITKA